jgi:hypothetical protein
VTLKNIKNAGSFTLPAVILSVIIALIVAVYLWKTTEPNTTNVTTTFPYNANCNLNLAPCVTNLPMGGQVQLSISPKPIPLVKPLHIQVKLTDIQADSVEVDFICIGMNMGFNRAQLKQKGSGQFEGDSMLPICIKRSMDWEARVLVSTEAGMLLIPFRFSTSR